MLTVGEFAEDLYRLLLNIYSTYVSHDRKVIFQLNLVLINFALRKSLELVHSGTGVNSMSHNYSE